MDVLVRIEGAKASYGAHSVLRGVDLVVHRGEVVGLLGINGAGKSTVVDLLTGRRRLAEGRMTLGEEPYAPESLEEAQACGVGVIAQNSEPPEDATVAQALFRNTYRADEPHESLRERASQLASEAMVELDVDAPVANLDRGRRALLEIVRMLAEEAQFVVIDEIAVTLADHEIAVLHHVLRRLAAQGRGILYITHRMDEIPSIAGRVLVLRDGRIAVDRPTDGLRADDLATLLLDAPPEEREAPPTFESAVDQVAIATIGVADGERLHGVDLRIRPGETVAVTGTHDSGVRELVEILGGERRPSRGRLLRNGRTVTFDSVEDAELHGISYLADAPPSAVGDRRLIEGVAGSDDELAGEIQRARRMIDLVRTLRINTTDINASVGELSGGDQQKAEFVRTVERGGDVLVLAHPTRGVDVGARRALHRFLRGLAASGTAVVVLGSDMTELLEWSDRVIVLAQGRIALEAASSDVDEDALVQAMLGVRTAEGLGRRAYREP